MNDKMTPDKERENCPCRKAIINPFDAMMMVVVRRLDKAYLELKRSKPPANAITWCAQHKRLINNVYIRRRGCEKRRCKHLHRLNGEGRKHDGYPVNGSK